MLCVQREKRINPAGDLRIDLLTMWVGIPPENTSGGECAQKSDLGDWANWDLHFGQEKAYETSSQRRDFTQPGGVRYIGEPIRDRQKKKSPTIYCYAIKRSAATGAHGEIQSGCTSTSTDLRRRFTDRIKRCECRTSTSMPVSPASGPRRIEKEAAAPTSV